MPIYEYECEGCGNHMEAWQRFSDAPLTTCEKCAGSMKKIISQSAFHLKGTGWYVTDYASKSGTSKTPSQKKESSPEVSKDSSGGSKEGGASVDKAE